VYVLALYLIHQPTQIASGPQRKGRMDVDQFTVFAEKFKAQGVEPRDVRLNMAIAEFQNNGGTYERALRLLRAAYEKGSLGQLAGAAKANNPLPLTSRTNDDEGQRSRADKANLIVPSSSPNQGKGQPMSADKAMHSMPSPLSLSIAKAAHKAVAKTVLDSFKVRDGRSIGDLAFCELEGLRFENAREASVIRQIQKHYANAPGNALVRDMIKESDLARFIQTGAEVADA
jgi:hypothetical protein